MNRLFELLKRFRFLLLFLFLEIVAFIFTSYYNTYQHSLLFNTLQDFTGNIYNKTASVKRFFHLRRMNDSLMTENSRLHSMISSFYLREKNIHPEIFDTNDQFRYIFKPAYVINNSVDKRKNYLVVNLGRNGGVNESMAVVTTSGIVGIVKHVSANYSLIMSVLNNDFRLNARIVETNDIGSLFWDGQSPDIVTIKDIPNQNLIRKGQHIVVGPYSQYFPENLPIGLVESIRLDKGGNFYNISVRLSGNMRNVMHVYIIKNRAVRESDSLRINSPE